MNISIFVNHPFNFGRAKPIASNLPLVEIESITVASVRVQNHSNNPNYLAASWYDIWLAN